LRIVRTFSKPHAAIRAIPFESCINHAAFLKSYMPVPRVTQNHYEAARHRHVDKPAIHLFLKQS